MKAVFLDSDGVINSLVYHEDAGVIDSPFKASQFKLLPRVPEAIRLLNDMGLKVAVVSNQPGIAKGHLKRETMKTFERRMLSGIRVAGGHIDRIYYCLHHPQAKLPKLRPPSPSRQPQIPLLDHATQ